MLFDLAGLLPGLLLMGGPVADRIDSAFADGTLLAASTGMYLMEGGAQPKKLLPISLAMYSGIINLATVGYGDIHPVTAAGKVFDGAAAV